MLGNLREGAYLRQDYNLLFNQNQQYTMKKLMNLPTFLILLFSSLLVLSSFSSIPVADVREDNPPVERKAESKRQKRLHKRYNRLYERFDNTTNTKQRHRLQKKIRKIERQQATNGSPVWGIIGLVLGVLAFILFVAAMALLTSATAAAAQTGTAIATSGTVAAFIAGLFAAIAGLVISIVSLILISKDPDKYSLKGFGIAGIIVGSVFIVIIGLALLISIALA